MRSVGAPADTASFFSKVATSNSSSILREKQAQRQYHSCEKNKLNANTTLSNMGTEDIDAEYGSYFENRAAEMEKEQKLLDIMETIRQFSIFFTLSVLVLGTFSCLFCMLILFLASNTRRRTSTHYLFALTLADLSFLASLSVPWLKSAAGVFTDRRMAYRLLCSLALYFSYVCSFLSTWFLVLFAIDRFIAVFYPVHYIHGFWGRPFSARILICMFTMVGLFLNFWIPYCIGQVILHDDRDVPEFLYGACTSITIANRSYFDVMNIFDTLMTFAAPALVIFVLAVAVCAKTYLCRGPSEQDNHFVKFEQQSSFTPSGAAGHLETIEEEEEDEDGEDKNAAWYMFLNLPINENEVEGDDRALDRLLYMLGVAWFLLNAPSYIVRLIEYVGTSLPHFDIYVAVTFTYLLFYVQFSVKFVFFLATKPYRRALTRCLMKIRHFVAKQAAAKMG